MEPSLGAVLGQARQVRKLSALDVALAAGISPASMSRLENDGVRHPSPNVLHQLSAALFADLTDDEQEELLEYLAWYRGRRWARGGANGSSCRCTRFEKLAVNFIPMIHVAFIECYLRVAFSDRD